MRPSISALCTALDQVILGKSEQVSLLVASALCHGHVLIEDVPGTGKTTLAKALAQGIGADFSRIQFTPDLMPTDVTGGAIFHPPTGQFVTHKGPVFTNILLADEINRASPRTQSALLEAMEERQVTLEGKTHALPEFFMVLATQNPIEFHGVFPLPEAQMDRFLVRLELGYPDQKTEEAILMAHKVTAPLSHMQAVLQPQDMVEFQKQVKLIHVDESLVTYAVALVRSTRGHLALRLPASPRAGMAMYRLAQAFAWMDERSHVQPEDIQRAWLPVMAHRVVPREGRGPGVTESLLQEILHGLPIPR